MTTWTAAILVWGSFFLFCAALLGFWGYAFYIEWQHSPGPQGLKTLADMQRAFRRGSKTSLFDRRRSSAIYAMQQFAEQEADATQRDAIAILMRDEIATALHKTDNGTANDVRRMLDTLRAAAPSWEADFLERVARSKLEGWVRGYALDRLVGLRGTETLGILLELIDDTSVAHAVALAIARLGRRAATPEVIAALERTLTDSQNGWAPSAAAQALISLGQATTPILARHLDRFDPWTAFTVRVTIAELDAGALIERLITGGVVAEDRRKLIKPAVINKMQKALNGGNGYKAVTTLLQRLRAIYIFDTEWDPVPDYEALLQELARIGGPRVTITDIALQMDGEACREVACQVARQPARFSPQFMGDWTDLSAVLNGLNTALAAADRPERFANLFSGDQNACVIVGHHDGLVELETRLGLPIDPGAKAAISIGAAAEDHVAAQLAASGLKVSRG
ncbi:HEAT repeat domain-containing protein [Bradyrhizobium sp. 83002]|uniref:HEAT repeat domain-containing protein n=1 Tax=Bradyrhizobium aeschynomenes TaxID=2734909 RepID=UPI001552BF58|nr:HEAT repeat domain-containing protein [Bradyrhizobium aeschynomenes]NPU10676.1 HEAT repeat domain-containing protein [Bradyrhizobium aeschynomenes]